MKFHKEGRKVLALLLVVGAMSLPVVTPMIISTLGISSYAAKKVIDILAAAGTVWSVVGIIGAVVGGGGIGVAILESAKWMIKRYGKQAAIAW